MIYLADVLTILYVRGYDYGWLVWTAQCGDCGEAESQQTPGRASYGAFYCGDICLLFSTGNADLAQDSIALYTGLRRTCIKSFTIRESNLIS